MTSEPARLKLHEHVMVEDWIGPDADARRERGEPPDRVYEVETVTDIEEDADGPDEPR